MLEKIFSQIKKDNYKIFAPKKEDGEIKILETETVPEMELLSNVSDRSWKYLLVPPREMLYKFEKEKIKTPLPQKDKTALFGMSIFDLKALELYDRVFCDDSYYFENRKNILTIGFSPTPLKNLKTIFFETENILENVIFDIFVENGAYYAGSKEGIKLLKKCNIRFKEIKHNPQKEDMRVLAIKTAVEKSIGNKMWDELGKICLACGKCTIVCPTCYCFDMESTIGPEKKTERCSGNCFYDDFTRIAGGHKFLNSPAEKIFFWYYHKFVRIPHQYGLPGCVDCGRCTTVCPVGIDIKKNIERLLKEPKKKR